MEKQMGVEGMRCWGTDTSVLQRPWQLEAGAHTPALTLPCHRAARSTQCKSQIPGQTPSALQLPEPNSEPSGWPK